MNFVDALLNALAFRKNNDYLNLWDVIQSFRLRITSGYETRQYLLSNLTFSTVTLSKLFYDREESSVPLVFWKTGTFENVQIQECDLSGVVFDQCVFINTSINNSKFNHCEFKETLSNAQFIECSIIYSKFNTTDDCQFLQTKITGSTFQNMQGRHLQGEIQDSSIVSLENVNATNSHFKNIIITSMNASDFSNTVMQRFHFESIYNIDFSNSTITWLEPITFRYPAVNNPHTIAYSNFTKAKLIDCSMGESSSKMSIEISKSNFYQSEFIRFQFTIEFSNHS